MLPDLLTENLILVICGTAVGAQSAKMGLYYAKRGNKFWRVLYEVGLTSELLTPTAYSRLLNFRIGLTDLVKSKSGMDRNLELVDFKADSLTEKIQRYRPRYLCFNGKRAARTFLERKVTYGLQKETVGITHVFVAPSTSGAANRWWDVEYWQQLAALCKKS